MTLTAEQREIRHICPACNGIQWVKMQDSLGGWQYLEEYDQKCPDCGVEMELDE